MTKYVITGEVTPDCTMLDTGEPAGTHDGQNYWTWTNDTGTWYLWYELLSGRFPIWRITELLGNVGLFGWGNVGPITTAKNAYGTAIGIANVAIYVPSSDNTPNSFSFTNVSNADLLTQYESNEQTITGMDAGTSISITGGEYRINGGGWTSNAGTIDPGDTLELRGTSSSSYGDTATISVTVGTSTVNWTITTANEIIYNIRNIQTLSTTIENGSVIVKCSGRGGINLVIKSLSKNPSELIIDDIQDKYDDRFDDPNYYWNKQTGV